MTRITYNPKQMVIKAEGHAGYAEFGKDIVCAGVSALMQSLRPALLERGIRNTMYMVTPGESRIEVKAEPECEQRYPCLVVFETVLAGLKEIARAYPDYVSIKVEKGER